MDENLQPPIFNTLEDECAYWKKRCHGYTQKLAEAKQEYNDFVENSRELEAELETTLEQREKTIRDLKSSLNQIQNDNESLRKKLINYESDFNTMEKSFKVLKDENEQLREHTRKVEQKNDDLERANRVVSATVTDLEAMLNQAYEKNEFLELEVEDKESLSVKHQRVLDELRDLKQELNVTKPPRNTKSPETHSENVMNGNATNAASQKAISIIADSLRRIDIMAAKLKACQEILPPSRPLTEAEYHAHQRRIQMITSKSPSLQSTPSVAAVAAAAHHQHLHHLNSSRLSGTFNNSLVGNNHQTITTTNSHESLPAKTLV